MVIDLGLEREGWDRPRQLRDWRPGPRPLRSFALVLCAALALTAAGSAAGPGPALVATATHQVDQRADFVVLGDRLYVSSDDPYADDRWLLSAYALPGGDPLWTAPYPSTVEQIVDLQRADGLVLVTGLVGGGGVATPTTALDAVTGQVRWTLPSRVTAGGDGRTGFIGSSRVEGPGAGVVRAVDLATGRDLWSATYPEAATVRPVADGRVLVLTRTGRAELREARGGAVLRSGTVSPPGSGPTVVIAAGDSLLLGYEDTTGARGVVAYAVDTLEARWRLPFPTDDGDVRRVATCGRLICTGLAGGVAAIDPVSGARVWAADGVEVVFEAGGLLVAAEPSTRFGVLDPATGHILFRLDGWSGSVATQEDSGLVVAAHRHGRSWLSLAEPGSAVPRVLGIVPHEVSNCVAGTGSVVCRTHADQLGVWTYR
jgi:hypothetical protein